MNKKKRWADYKEPWRQLEAMLGIKLEPWQRDWVKRIGDGQRLERVLGRYVWIDTKASLDD